MFNKIKKYFSTKKNKTRGYAGANFGRLTSSWSATTSSADQEIKSSLKTLRARSRQLERDNDYVRQYLRTAQNNIVGKGIRFQSQIKDVNGNMDDKLNTLIEDKFNQWCRKENCHVSGKLSFSEIERMVVRSKYRDGEAIVRLVNRRFGNSKVPFAIEVIESDFLDDDYSVQRINENMIKMGVEIDSWSRPVGYHFFSQHPGDSQYKQFDDANLKRIRVDSKEIIHLFEMERPGQTRGVPELASAFLRIHQLNGYEEASVVRARASASVMGIIKTPDPETGEVVQNGERIESMEPGKMFYLQPGEEFQMADASPSTGEFDPFVRLQLRAIAAGGGVSYESLSKDYSQSNYSSSRLSILEERDNWRVKQQWLIDSFHQKVFEEWLDHAVAIGELNLPDYHTNKYKYQNVKWFPRGWAWVDPLKDTESAIAMVQAGFKSIDDVVSEMGGDFEDVIHQRAREKRVCQKLGIELTVDAVQSQNKNMKTNEGMKNDNQEN